MPFNDNLPAENTNPWYTPLVTAWTNLKTFVNALEAKIGVANGIASLGSDGKLPVAQLPALAVSEYLGSVATQAAMLALTGQQGDWAIRTDRGTVFVITGNPAIIGGWIEMAYPTAPVTSVAGRAGTVVLAKADVGLNLVDNTSDASKPVSTTQQAALDAKVAKVTTAPVQAGLGWYQRLSLSSYSTGAEGEPFLVEGFRTGAARRAFWLNENGSPRGASVNSEPAMKLFGPDADDAYSGLLFQILKRYGLQTNRFGMHSDGRFRIGDNLTPASPGVVVLEAAASVPTGLPAGTVIVRKP